MTLNEQKSLIAFGESIDVKVSPIQEADLHGVAIGDLVTFSVKRANHELQVLSILRCPEGYQGTVAA